MSQSIEQLRELFQDILAPDKAAIFASSTGLNQNTRYVTIDLTTASLSTQPYVINFPFRSFVVLSTTDSSVSVNMRLGSNDSSQDSFPIKNNSSIRLPFPVAKGFLDWSAQSGKSISILFLLSGDFSTNQLVSSVSAAVQISEGSSITSIAGAQVTTTAAQLFAADTARIKMRIQNQSSIPIYLGDSAVTVPGGAKPGFSLLPGAMFDFESTAALYAISSGANTGATDISLTKFS